MTTTPSHRHALHCILPPHVLENIARNGTADERARALDTLSADITARYARSARQLEVRQALPGEYAQAAAPHKNRVIYDAKHGSGLPGALAREEGSGPVGDAATDEAYDGLGATFDLYWAAYGRDSIDNAGNDLVGSVHFGQDYDNAFWDGRQMVFGDGDGQYFNRFTIAVDIMGHELTHGVTAHQADLEYQDQPGALNESISDVFGSLVKQHAHHPPQTAEEADWLIGAGLFTAAVHGTALRSMKDPGSAYDDSVLGKDPQPAHMADYVTTTRDHGGVHINSGIPNRAFYLAAVGLGGYAWEKAGLIWYRTLCDARLTRTAQFQDFADLTTDNASRLFGPEEQQIVADAWRQVGIEVRVPRISGTWILHFSWGSTLFYGQADLTFNADGTFGGAYPGQWRMRDGGLLLAFDDGPAKYFGTVDGNVGTGEMSTFADLDGSFYLTRRGIVGLVENLSGGAMARQQPLTAAGNPW
ncbi:M4 family metallopeptidase [Amycolatopsis sp. NPDC004747]